MNQRRDDDEIRAMIEQLERELGPRPAKEVGPMPDRDFSDRRQARPEGIPIAGSEPRQARLRVPAGPPRVAIALIAINVLMYVVTFVLSSLFPDIAPPVSRDAYTNVLFLLGAKFGPAIDAGQYWRFLTPIVLHGSLIHLLFNSYALYALGPAAERIFGSLRFLAVYLLAGFAGTIASYMRSPGLSIGASGAIFGVLGALAAFFYLQRGGPNPEASRQQLTQLITMAAINIFFGLSVPSVDNAAHVGGMVAGAVSGLALAPRYRVDDRLYPPAIVRADRPALGWLLAGLILVALLVWTAAVLGRYGN